MIMAIVGGAIMPYFMGALADRYSTALSYLLPLLCFAVVLVCGSAAPDSTRRRIGLRRRCQRLWAGSHQDRQRQQQHDAGQHAVYRQASGVHHQPARQ